MEYERTVTQNPWLKPPSIKGPPHPKQREFLLHTFTREVFFGGAAAGGKSDALWMGALQYVTEPDYAAIIFRRTYADLALPGALMDRSKGYLAGSTAKWNETTKTWTFPSGATVTFAYLQTSNDKYRYASAEFQYIAFDELTHFDEDDYRFLFSRLRKNISSSIPLRMRAASNPGGRGHTWVKKRFIDEKTRLKSAVVLRSFLEDNPTVDQKDYEENLMNLGPVAFQQLRRGLWVDPDSGAEFPPAWFEGDDLFFYDWPETEWRVIALDPSMAEKEDSDLQALVMAAESPDGKTIYLDAHIDRTNATILAERSAARIAMWESELGAPSDGLGIEVVVFSKLLVHEFRRVAADRKTAGYGMMMPTVYPLPVGKKQGDNNTRIRQLTSFLHSRKFRFRETPGGRLLVKQFQEFPIGDHDDGPVAVQLAIRLMRYLQAHRKKKT